MGKGAYYTKSTLDFHDNELTILHQKLDATEPN